MPVLIERKAHLCDAKPVSGYRPSCASLLVLAIICFISAAGLRSPALAEPVITVTLNGANTQLKLTRSMLNDMPTTRYTTSTVWTEEENTYTGVLLYDFLEALSVDMTPQNGQVIFSALDNYTAVLPFSDIDRSAPMIAFLRDDAALPLRSQGPFWLIWPYDLSNKYRTETIYARSIWHIVSIDIEY